MKSLLKSAFILFYFIFFLQNSYANGDTIFNNTNEQELKIILQRLHQLGYYPMPVNTKKIESAIFPFDKRETYHTLSNYKFFELQSNQNEYSIGQLRFNTFSQTIAYTNSSLLVNPIDQTSFALSIDPLAEKYASLSPYNTMNNDPINRIDPDGKDAIYIAFPDYLIETPMGKIGGLGHGAVLLIDKDGKTKYYEYGRYDKAKKGLVRTLEVPSVTMDSDGKPTVASLNVVLGQLSKKAGHGGRIEGAYVESDKF